MLNDCILRLNLHYFDSSAPDENPSGVHGEGTEADNLVISWTVSSLSWDRKDVFGRVLSDYIRVVPLTGSEHDIHSFSTN